MTRTRAAPASALLLALLLAAPLLAAPFASAQAPSGLTWRLVANAPKEDDRDSLYLVRQLAESRFCGAVEDTPNFGRILCSADGGATWAFVPIDGSPNATSLIRGMWFLPGAGDQGSRVGWAVGAGYVGEVSLTKDAGATWTSLTDEFRASIGGNPPPLHWVEPLSETTAYVAGAYDVFFTKDGGQAWEKRAGPDLGGQAFQFFDMWNEADGFALNHTHIYKTTDGAKAWTARELPWNKPGALPLVLGLRALDANTFVALVVAAGEDQAKLWRTTDSGATWTNVSSQPLSIGRFRNLGHYTVVGARHFVGGAGYIASSDDGVKWNVEYNNASAPWEVRFRDPLGTWSGGPGLPFAWASSQGYYKGRYVKDQAVQPPTPSPGVPTPTAAPAATPATTPTVPPTGAPPTATPAASPAPTTSPPATAVPTGGTPPTGDEDAPGPGLVAALAAVAVALALRTRRR